ncbi:hypothetical protein [Ectobacillus panaciterrae]|uniref:hypothetical protein n=1 Tax=Ectobacillus panaciterrae TaxID=363872 RepID=UPI00041485E4|nr:hypothetical protein [Ectobacillus panaciterrae]
MFDPTVYENLKVIAEGAVYDRDLDGEILVTNRRDLIDLAAMSRTYHISFQLREEQTSAAFILTADTKNLAGEILEERFVPGCQLQLKFAFSLSSLESCGHMQQLFEDIWGKERMITQRISYEYNKQAISYEDEVTIFFQKVITEDHADDLPVIIEYMIKTLHTLKDILEK